MIRRLRGLRRKLQAESEADQALAEAKTAQRQVEEQRVRMEPVLERIGRHVADNAIYEAFVETLGGMR